MRERRVQYHCYSQLEDYIQEPGTEPYPAPISSTTTTTTTSREEMEGETCPQSSLAQCTCDLELELSGEEVQQFSVTSHLTYLTPETSH